MDVTHLVAALRAIGPTLIALVSIIAVPVARHTSFGRPGNSSERAETVVIALLFASGLLALIAGSDYRSSALIGGIPIDPSEPGRLLVALGAPIFAILGGAAVVLFMSEGTTPAAILIETS